MPANLTAQEAVLKAAGEMNPELVEEETQEVEVPKVETKPAKEQEVEDDESEEVETEEVDPAKEERIRQALQILDLLEDSENGPNFIRHLAQSSGLLTAQTPRQEQKAQTKFKDLVMQKLGSEYAFLAEPLGDALETISEEIRNEFKDQIRSVEAQRISHDISLRTEKFLAENKVTKSEYSQLEQLATVMPANPQVPVERYLENLLLIARTKQTENNNKIKTATKITDNLKRKSTRGLEGEPSSDKPEKVPVFATGVEAVKYALRKQQGG